MKNKHRHLIGHLVLATALCVMAGVGFVFIMETLTARTVGFHSALGQRAPAPATPSR